MKITKLEPLSRARSRVYIDEEFAFVLYRGELRTYELKEGAEIREDAYREIWETVLPKRAKLRAMNLLKTRQYTARQLMEKLQTGGYPEVIAKEALEYVKSFRYVDDARYIRDYVEYHRETRSLKDIERRLLQKGISRELLKDVLSEFDGQETEQSEMEAIRRLLAKKHYVKDVMEEKEREKLYAYFYRKGFSVEKVKRVLQEL